ncbi:flagellar biosynthetic protein FlhB [Sporobacter termitidis DSM 10068]|uniref:Flagellar biosynthetic protein FlhB n=1 Tax=Sporobacter termitidis DSM 10068 TaxID=1123282 RepID=A0A1M5W7B8_9FIRM|nr:flagellar biosynthesis protein FlhB [Sporobacter termitidis]SHH83377.1 flagellar biosynthetic protein FlhB [Sporobacter termitidis DSM 10068]
MAQGSGEKTEKASPKKRRDTRKKGEVHKSSDMCSAIMLFITFGTLKVGYEGFLRSMRGFSSWLLSDSVIVGNAKNVTASSVVLYYKDILNGILPLLLPFMLIVMIGGAVVHVVQTGPMFITEKLKPDFKKINPINGFKRIFSSASLVELGKSIFKIVILGYIVYSYFSSALKSFANMIYSDVGAAFSKVLSTSFSMGIMIGLALIAFSAVDVLYQWWKFEKDIRMTKQEVKEENKQLEGDPQIKAKIRQKQRRMSAQRMMKNLPDATVVVTNPDHFAVALRYDDELDKAPVVIAKGQDYLAQRIKKKAKELDIAIVENKPVARALYAACEVGHEIPPELYQAIADILIYVYKAIKA